MLIRDQVVQINRATSTNRLKKATIEPEDVTVITAGMSKCSNHTGHVGAQEANAALPSPEEMETEINALQAWRESVVARRDKKRQAIGVAHRPVGA